MSVACWLAEAVWSSPGVPAFMSPIIGPHWWGDAPWLQGSENVHLGISERWQALFPMPCLGELVHLTYLWLHQGLPCLVMRCNVFVWLKTLQIFKIPLALWTHLGFHSVRFPKKKKPPIEQLRVSFLVKIKIKCNKGVRWFELGWLRKGGGEAVILELWHQPHTVLGEFTRVKHLTSSFYSIL